MGFELFRRFKFYPSPVTADPIGDQHETPHYSQPHGWLYDGPLSPLASVGRFSGTPRSSPAPASQRFDVDHDGTIDPNEAWTAASALLDRLDSDHDGTLDRRELRGRLSGQQFAAADPDHDGTLSQDEYLAVVEKRFTAADSDHDGTLDAKELNSPAGRTFLRLTM